ncbi:MAG: LiaI-LiaF-like domain-containing protein [Bacteroidota bacterium]
MAAYTSSRSGAQFFFGLLITCVGVVLLLDRLNVIDAYDYFRYWPLLIILFGAIKFIRSKRPAGLITGVLIMLFGGLLTVDNLTYFHVHFWQWWPIVIILLGASLLFNTRSKWHTEPASDQQGVGQELDSTVSLFYIMSGGERTITSQDFQGGEITTIMGGCKLDLRQASIKNTTAVVDLFIFWGGIEITVPRDWHVIMNGHPILGGMENKTFPPTEATQKQLIIKGYAIMGGAAVKNL